MANTTIYPFGPGGELPDGIAVVNDLTTGGADKALSAQMGKYLGDEVLGQTINETIDQDTYPDEDYRSYSKSGNTRGYMSIALPGSSFTFTVTTEEDSPVKVGVQSRSTEIIGSGSAAYDSGWLTVGTTYQANPSDFTQPYLCVVFTYVSGGTGVPTLAEIRQYVSFLFHASDRVASLKEQIADMHRFDMTGVIAHRGLHVNGIPENSIDAYRYAGACKFEFAETDFCPTSDGYLVLMHDASINRTMKNASDYSTISGTVNVASKTLAELQADYVLASSDKRFRRTIPLLEDYFKTCKQYGVFPVPEIKDSGVTDENIKTAYEMGCSILGEGNFAFCSFEYSFLDYVRTLSDKTPLFYIGNSILGTVNSLTGESRDSALNIWYPQHTNASLDADLVADYHSRGMKVAVWTITVENYDAMAKMGIDIIATDEAAPLRWDVGDWVRSDSDFSAFTTAGTVADDALQLTTGQSVSWTGDSTWLGGYFLEIIGKGAFTVTAPNLSQAVSSADIDTFRFSGIVDNKTMQVSVAATGASEIQFISIKKWEI